jgi:2'-5' RNA ligase
LIDESLFQLEAKLHLTIAVLNISDNQESEACDLFNSFYERIVKDVLKDEPLTIKIQGVDMMTTFGKKKLNPSQAHVLYAKIANPERLQAIANQMSKEIGETKYSAERDASRLLDDVKLHITLMNSDYRRRSMVKKMPNRRHAKRDPFDASMILRDFKNHVFGEVVCDRIELNRLGGEKEENGFYKKVARIEFSNLLQTT